MQEAGDAPDDEEAEVAQKTAKRKLLLAHIGMVVVGCIFGGLNVITSRALKGVNPTIFALYRNVGSSMYIVMQWLAFEGNECVENLRCPHIMALFPPLQQASRSPAPWPTRSTSSRSG